MVYTCNFGARLKQRLAADKRTAGISLQVATPPVELLEAVVDELDRVNSLSMLHAGYDNATEEVLDRIFKALVKLAGGGLTQPQMQAAGQKVVDDNLTILAEDWFRVPTDVIRKIGLGAAMEGAYQKALAKRRKNIIKATAFTVVSGLAIALPGTTGFAAYVFARTALGLTQQLVEHNMKLTQAAKVLETQLKYLSEAFKHGAALRATSETGATTLNALLGVDVVPTLAKATSNYKDLELNCTHAGFKCRKLNDEIAASLDSLKVLGKSVAKLTGKDREKMEKLIAKSEAALDALLKKTASLAKQFNTVDRKLATLKKVLDALGKNTKLQDIVNYSAKVLVSLAGIAAGGLADASIAVDATAVATRGIAEVVAVTNGVVGVLTELHEAHKSAKDLAKEPHGRLPRPATGRPGRRSGTGMPGRCTVIPSRAAAVTAAPAGSIAGLAAAQSGMPPSTSSPVSSTSASKFGIITPRLPVTSMIPSFFSADICRLTVSSVRPR